MAARAATVALPRRATTAIARTIRTAGAPMSLRGRAIGHLRTAVAAMRSSRRTRRAPIPRQAGVIRRRRGPTPLRQAAAMEAAATALLAVTAVGATVPRAVTAEVAAIALHVVMVAEAATAVVDHTVVEVSAAAAEAT